MKNRLAVNRNLILPVVISIILFSLAVVGAILAFPSGTTDLRAQTCNTETAAGFAGFRNRKI